jgi:uncharacterized RDD family membrane protein YckC
MIYAGFGKRFAATLVDVVVLLPLFIAREFLTFYLETWTAVSFILSIVLVQSYYIFCHSFWGQTLGKRAVGIRIVKVSGERITWREAILRSLVDVVFTLIFIFSMLPILFPNLEPVWLRWAVAVRSLWLGELGRIGDVWFWSELITMLFNKKKRALHDFIAGTVVIQEQAATLEQSLV